MLHDRCASLDGDADRLVYFTQQDEVFQLFDGDRIAVLAALLVRDILADLPLPPQEVKVSKTAHLPESVPIRFTVGAAIVFHCNMTRTKGHLILFIQELLSLCVFSL